MNLQSVLFSALVLLGISLNGNASDRLQSNGAFFALSVQDLDSSVAWYQKHLGFQLSARSANEHRSGALLSREDATLELTVFKDAQALNSLQKGIQAYDVYGIFKIGFMTNDIEETFTQLESSGAEIFFGIVSTSDGNKTFGIKDNEGNIIQFYGK